MTDYRGQKTEDRDQGTEDRDQMSENKRQRMEAGFWKFDWKVQVGEAVNRLTHRSRNIQDEMKEIVRTQPDV
jgi:hypothetical protein